MYKNTFYSVRFIYLSPGIHLYFESNIFFISVNRAIYRDPFETSNIIFDISWPWNIRSKIYHIFERYFKFVIYQIWYIMIKIMMIYHQIWYIVIFDVSSFLFSSYLRFITIIISIIIKLCWCWSVMQSLFRVRRYTVNVSS